MLCLERDMKRSQLEEDATKSPHVAGIGIQLLGAYLRAEIIWCTYSLLYNGRFTIEPLRNAEVTNPQIILLRQEEVLRLDIAVDNVALVQMLQTESSLRHPTKNLRLIEQLSRSAVVSDPLREVTTFRIIHHDC